MLGVVGWSVPAEASGCCRGKGSGGAEGPVQKGLEKVLGLAEGLALRGAQALVLDDELGEVALLGERRNWDTEFAYLVEVQSWFRLAILKPLNLALPSIFKGEKHGGKYRKQSGFETENGNMLADIGTGELRWNGGHSSYL